MKYNNDIHPLYKSIGEKLEKWLIDDPYELDTMYYLGETAEGRQKYITMDNGFHLSSYPTLYTFTIDSNIFTKEENLYIQNHTKYNCVMIFNLGYKPTPSKVFNLEDYFVK